MTSAWSTGLYISLVVVGIVALAGTAFYLASAKRRKNAHPGQLSTITGESMRVIDISPIKERPVFEPLTQTDHVWIASLAYTPGSNMRVAHQNTSGSWSFLDPNHTSAPQSLADFDIEAQRRKFAEAARYAVETSRPLGTIEPPPPSYSQIDWSPLSWA
ncbi:hypothetical protein OF83DRAFT_1196809 [Amylostereum chailletii]|nr:hypothetical protein OF83DRAFT_1196809 [Amylostereum chailletii]